jgi:hypothetical protein
MYIYKRVLCVLLSRSKFHMSDTRIYVSSVSRVIVLDDLECVGTCNIIHHEKKFKLSNSVVKVDLQV